VYADILGFPHTGFANHVEQETEDVSQGAADRGR
jgi:hypothetical protein